MEAFIFLAATVSRSFISYPPDHCWTLVTLVSVDLGILNQQVGPCAGLPFPLKSMGVLLERKDLLML